MSSIINNKFLYRDLGLRTNLTYVCNEITDVIESNLIRIQSVKMCLDGGFWKRSDGSETGFLYDVNFVSTPFMNKIFTIRTDNNNVIINIDNHMTSEEELKFFGKVGVIDSLKSFIGRKLSNSYSGSKKRIPYKRYESEKTEAEKRADLIGRNLKKMYENQQTYM